MVKYLVFTEAQRQQHKTTFVFYIFVFYIFVLNIFAAEDSCDSHVDCVDLSSVGYCCRDYSRNSSRSCTNISSCLDRFCRSNNECVYSSDECCLSNKCIKCSFCKENYDCGSRQYCCKTNLYGHGGRCDFSCIGKPCSNLLSCGAPGECCRSGECAKCSDSGCRFNSECTSGQYCCRQGEYYFKQRHCNSSCIGESCNYHSDCGGKGECCQSNKCVKCPYTVCKYNGDCSIGQYCCGRDLYSLNLKGICINESCLGKFCSSSRDCGSPGVCCHSGICTESGCHCSSNYHCSNGHYCCTGTWYGQCSTSCVGETCMVNHDCGGSSKEWCRRGVCARGQCDSHFHCDKLEFSCCKKQFSNESSECKEHCINESCSSDNDCARSNECCGTNHKCTSDCEKNFPVWIILVTTIVVFLFGIVAFFIMYCRNKPIMHQRTQQLPSQGCVEMVPADSANTTVHNNVVPNIPPPYSANDETFVLVQNIPPPPYATNDETILSELEQDLPPNYQLI